MAPRASRAAALSGLRHARRHLSHRRQLLGFHELGLGALELVHLGRQRGVEVGQLGARVPEVFRHVREAPGEVADLVARCGMDGMVEVATAHHRHGGAELTEGPGQAAGDEPRSPQAGECGEDEDPGQDLPLIVHDLLHARERT
jgi:hypothetical protein